MVCVVLPSVSGETAFVCTSLIEELNSSCGREGRMVGEMYMDGNFERLRQRWQRGSKKGRGINLFSVSPEKPKQNVHVFVDGIVTPEICWIKY